MGESLVVAEILSNIFSEVEKREDLPEIAVDEKVGNRDEDYKKEVSQSEESGSNWYTSIGW